MARKSTGFLRLYFFRSEKSPGKARKNGATAATEHPTPTRTPEPRILPTSRSRRCTDTSQQEWCENPATCTRQSAVCALRAHPLALLSSTTIYGPTVLALPPELSRHFVNLQSANPFETWRPVQPCASGRRSWPPQRLGLVEGALQLPESLRYVLSCVANCRLVD